MINKKIEEASEYLTGEGKPLTATYIMWAVMNTTTDEELYTLGSDIVDVAEKIEFYLTGVAR